MRANDGMTRRTVLRAGAGMALALGAGSVPAWARPVRRPALLRTPDSLPFPGRPAGRESLPQIEHVVVLMLENHSFDNILGALPLQVPQRRGVDGLRRGRDGRRPTRTPMRPGRPSARPTPRRSAS